MLGTVTTDYSWVTTVRERRLETNTIRGEVFMVGRRRERKVRGEGDVKRDDGVICDANFQLERRELRM